MPIYEYKCAKCAKVFEVLQKFSDEPLKVHENCGGAVQRLISPPVFQFKGSGWYITDYAHKHGSSATNGEGHNGSSNGTSNGASNAPAKESPKESSKDGAAHGAESKPAAPAPKS